MTSASPPAGTTTPATGTACSLPRLLAASTTGAAPSLTDKAALASASDEAFTGGLSPCRVGTAAGSFLVQTGVPARQRVRPLIKVSPAEVGQRQPNRQPRPAVLRELQIVLDG